MTNTAGLAFIRTIKKRCRMCYTCVRECPAKAIRIADGQAEVIPERCIGCGNCVKVCSQSAKQVVSTIDEVNRLLEGDCQLAALIAPSFPAEFAELSPQQFVGMVRALGFDLVCEVGFGADLVAREYAQLLAQAGPERYIATTCPAIFGYVERYHPEMVDKLAPIVSPMLAMARALRQIHGAGLKPVFIGPCVAKKAEAASVRVEGEAAAVITFIELREMFMHRAITPDWIQPSEFDPPRPGLGALFPLKRGLLQAAHIEEDLVTENVISTGGHRNFVDAIGEFEAGDFDAQLLEVLCCDGCIMGPGVSCHAPQCTRRSRISQYVRARMATLDQAQWEADMARFAGLDLSRTFKANDQRLDQPGAEELQDVLLRMGKHSAEDELNCGACGYDTCRAHAVAILRGLAESEMCLPFTIEQTKKAVDNLAVTNQELAQTQHALVQSEKLASMGQLAAGIAHEVNNPLGVVLMYAHLLLDECPPDAPQRADLEMVAAEADRCKKIVAGLLNFARQNRVLLQPVDVVEMVGQCLRTLPPPEGVAVELHSMLDDPSADLDADQITQVLINLVTNAYAAMPGGGTLTLSLSSEADNVNIAVADTGIGIPEENRKKVFEPFFTTKQMGKGTGLGLAVSYGIVKMHRGDIRMHSNADPAQGPTGTTFMLILPRRARQDV
jgi:signal transduction histidine kinase/iron only hydrogenase large subunit-like protein